jgi:hypothetical protein
MTMALSNSFQRRTDKIDLPKVKMNVDVETDACVEVASGRLACDMLPVFGGSILTGNHVSATSEDK